MFNYNMKKAAFVFAVVALAGSSVQAARGKAAGAWNTTKNVTGAGLRKVCKKGRIPAALYLAYKSYFAFKKTALADGATRTARVLNFLKDSGNAAVNGVKAMNKAEKALFVGLILLPELNAGLESASARVFVWNNKREVAAALKTAKAAAVMLDFAKYKKDDNSTYADQTAFQVAINDAADEAELNALLNNKVAKAD